MTVSGCKKCCVSSAVNGTDGDVLWNDSEDGNSDTDWLRKIESDKLYVVSV
jgi:hypothetical protein